MSSSWGKFIKINIFGESHGIAVGGTLEGFPSGFLVDLETIKIEMDRRNPKGLIGATKRSETDEVKIISGVYNNYTTGSPLSFNIENKEARSEDYESFKDIPRPGHSDYTGGIRYKGQNDVRGGGHFSGRLTAPLTFIGTLCKQYLQKKYGVEIKASLKSPDEKFVEKINSEGDSIGGIIECKVEGIQSGLGSPMFRGAESIISSILYGIPAVKGVSFGAGFDFENLKGSEANDTFVMENAKIKTKTNFCGGILGGITTGMPIELKVAIKPTPSIGLKQNTLNLKTGQESMLQIVGRHDACIAMRAPVIVESAIAIALLDMYMEAYGYVSG